MADETKEIKPIEKAKAVTEIFKGIVEAFDWAKALPHFVRTLILAIACMGAGTAGTVAIITRGTDSQVVQMRATIGDLSSTIKELQANNRQLTIDKNGLVATNTALAEESSRQGQAITGLTTELGHQRNIISLLTAESKRNQQIIDNLANIGREFDKGLGQASTDLQSVIERLQSTKDTVTGIITQVNHFGIQ